jgi:hypothetical protein
MQALGEGWMMRIEQMNRRRICEEIKRYIIDMASSSKGGMLCFSTRKIVGRGWESQMLGRYLSRMYLWLPPNKRPAVIKNGKKGRRIYCIERAQAESLAEELFEACIKLISYIEE